MDPVTIGVIGGLATTSKSIADLIMSIKDNSRKSQLEAAKAQIDLAKAQLEAVAKERDALVGKNGELQKENEDLSEKVAHHELTQEYDIKEGLLYKKGTGDGPYCQVDRYQMTFHGHEFANKKWKCPKCGQEVQTLDPALADDYVGNVGVLKFGRNPFSDYRG